MLENIVRGETETRISYEVDFWYDNTGGFSFPCKENGEPFPDLNPVAKENYEWCMKNPDRFRIFNHVRKEVHRWRNPDHGRCHCGAEVYLENQYMGACECPKCGQWYNLSGQELLPPKDWGLDDEEYEAEEWW